VWDTRSEPAARHRLVNASFEPESASGRKMSGRLRASDADALYVLAREGQLAAGVFVHPAAPSDVLKAVHAVLSSLPDDVTFEAVPIVAMVLDGLAEEFEITSGYLSILVRSTTQRGFLDHLHALRIIHAAWQLQDVGKPIRQVATECGYRRVSHFDRHFTAPLHVTPQRYRRLSYRARFGTTVIDP
jgi:AraC-like DNA-binding protein